MSDDNENEKKIGSLVKGKNSAADMLTGKAKVERKAETYEYKGGGYYGGYYGGGYRRSSFNDHYDLGSSYSYPRRRNYNGTTEGTGRELFDDEYLASLREQRQKEKDEARAKAAKPRLPFAPSDGTIRIAGEKAYMARATLERIVVDTMKLVDEMMSANKVILDAKDRDKIKAQIRTSIYQGYGEDSDGMWAKLVIE